MINQCPFIMARVPPSSLRPRLITSCHLSIRNPDQVPPASHVLWKWNFLEPQPMQTLSVQRELTTIWTCRSFQRPTKRRPCHVQCRYQCACKRNAISSGCVCRSRPWRETRKETSTSEASSRSTISTSRSTRSASTRRAATARRSSRSSRSRGNRCLNKRRGGSWRLMIRRTRHTFRNSKREERAHRCCRPRVWGCPGANSKSASHNRTSRPWIRAWASHPSIATPLNKFKIEHNWTETWICS